MKWNIKKQESLDLLTNIVESPYPTDAVELKKKADGKTYLIITFNTAAGKTPIELDVSSLIDDLRQQLVKEEEYNKALVFSKSRK